MEKKLEKAIRNLQKSSKINPLSRFSYNDSRSGNTFKAKVFYNKEDHPSIEISQVNGYRKDELLLQLESSLNSIFPGTLPYAKSGSLVYTRRNAAKGDVVTLESSTYYYAIDTSIFNCSGEQLGSRFQATCISNLSAKCSPTSAIALYTIYKLL
ncbi:hypothetical protein VB264_21120 [Arcicella aquatica]|uniref:Uncharacterized protein n=1 Tax=Arcicella aquatica TaxID=217141 RepID=A0ABU5QUG2_9BACT|nr:hypothetical protein [Arcicella aquatica]MEA5260314.1 hypothetical protein [Arcicella aquatica]